MEAVMEFILTNLPLILCLGIGVALLVLEVFVPGFGLPGIAGVILVVTGIILTWMHYGVVAGLAVTLICLAVAGISISISIKSASTLILHEETKEMDHEETEAFLGKEGEALTVLNPAGIAEFDGVRLNVVSEASYLEKGARVKVLAVEGNRIVVREIKG